MSRRSRGIALWALLLVSGLFLIPPDAVYAGADDGSSSNHAIPFMRMGAGTRALGMGGAYVAAANDATAGYWNPAGLGWACGTQLSAMYALGMTTDGDENDRRMSYLAASHHFGWGGLGISLLTAGLKDAEQRDNQGNFVKDFDFGDLAVMFHGAYATDLFSVGATFKYLHQGVSAEVADDAANGMGFDLGAMVQPLEWMRLGIAMRDIATEVGSDESANDAPLDLRGGVALAPLSGFTFALDLGKVEHEDDMNFHAGAEYAFPFSEDFGGALRMGLNDGHLTAGLGVKVRFLEFDYAYVEEPQGFMEQSHRIGVTAKLCEETAPFEFEPRVSDSDSDGISDAEDACPSAAEDFDGFEDADGCPDVDNDGDGIPDAEDDCPNLAEDFDGFNDLDGCPDVDNDGDGIRDVDDKCPNAAEVFNKIDDEDGCPDKCPVVFPLAYINFRTASSEIASADPIPVLDQVVQALKENPELKVTVIGHTDNVGTDEYNVGLSMRRAEAVRDYLIKKGIAAGRLSTEGKGESTPIAPNETEEGRARNRRIEFKVVG